MTTTTTTATREHPCFAEHHGEAQRVHLPVAPRCNVRCGFCRRDHDCVNESRPGVTSQVLTPTQASWYVDRLAEHGGSLDVVGIAGPGDPLANPEAVLATLHAVAEQHPDAHLCLSTNGLALAGTVRDLAAAGVRHLTITISAVDEHIAARIYRWIRDGDELLRGIDAGRRMVVRQLAGLAAAVRHGMTVKVNTILIPGVNDNHVAEVARVVAQLGAERQNLMPMIPVAGTDFAHLLPPDAERTKRARAACSTFLPQMTHCGHCRADAAGPIGRALFFAQRLLQEARTMDSTPLETRTRVAVASREGALVNVGLGRAKELLIYAEQEDHFELVDVREAPPGGHAAGRWEELAAILHDCSTVVAAEAGAQPTRALGDHGIKVLATEGMISDALELVFAGNTEALRPPSCDGVGNRCGTGCGSGANGGVCA